ncbi:MAG: ABC transporter substrate binding protein [Desulfuromonas sp.]|nr:ABC transporter substrate binding protein [Desulfuromonas sp.]
MGQIAIQWIGKSFLLPLFIFLLPLLAGAQVEEKKVLILNSYNKGFTWTDNVVSGIETVLKPAENNIDLCVEYMDTKSMGHGAAYQQVLYELYHFKYHDQKFDVIISSDDDAFNFLNDYRDKLFPEVPVVYCGVNNREAPNLNDPSAFTGVLESLATEQTIDLILNIHPETRKIYLVIDTTPSGNYLWEVTSPSISLFPNIEFIRISDQYSLGEIENLVSELGEEAAILYYVLSRDRSGKSLSVKESATRVINASSRPVYTTHLLEFPYGVVGGKILRGYDQGELVAEMAQRILNGEPVDSIPVVKNNPTQFVFNYDQLTKWNIPLSDLPVDSIFFNRPVSLYEQNKTLVLGVVGFIFIMVGFVIILLVNVLRRKKTEMILRESEEKFRALAETSPLAIYASSGPDEKGEYINPTYTKLFGYTLEEVPTLNDWWPLAYPDESYRTSLKNEWQQRVEHAIATKSEIEPIEAVVQCKDGSEKIISWGFNALGKQNWALGLDLTERKQLEAQLLQKHKMEAVGFMAGGMAHNFNNNLSIVLGNVELAQMKLPPGSEVTSLLENAKTAIRRSRDLVKKIITYSRQGVTHKIPMRLKTIIDETIDLLSPTLPSTIVLTKSYSPECENHLVKADPSQIQEVLINLCNNAVQAMDEKGVLEISLDLVDLEGKNIPAQYDCSSGRYNKLSVSDSGCGMPAEMLDKIFDPFYSTKEAHEGAGLGLSTVQGIVVQHGGIIKVNSLLGQGTTFDIYFPLIERVENVEPALGKTTLLKGSERILFVDDDDNLATLGEQLLGTLGYQISTTTDSTEALKMFTANAEGFDLVITDQTMPELTGVELITEIKKVRANIPTILCTGHSSKVDAGKARELGISAFMMKPLELSVLSQTIRSVLGKDEES